MPEEPDSNTQRIAALEDRTQKHDESIIEYRTLKAMLAGVIVLIVSTAGAAGGMLLTDRTRLEVIEQRLREHESLPSHRGTVEAMSELRSDLRVISHQLVETNARATEIRDRLGRVEVRMDAASVPLHR